MISYPNYKFIFPVKAMGMYARRFGDSEVKYWVWGPRSKDERKDISPKKSPAVASASNIHASRSEQLELVYIHRRTTGYWREWKIINAATEIIYQVNPCVEHVMYVFKSSPTLSSDVPLEDERDASQVIEWSLIKRKMREMDAMYIWPCRPIKMRDLRKPRKRAVSTKRW